jgi:biopolymer transport protein ExbD
MKTTFFNRSYRTSVDSVMTPMIDVVFLLLIFFLSSSSFQRPEKTLPSTIAASPDLNKSGNQPDSQPPNDLSDLSDVVVAIRLPKNQPSSVSLEYTINGDTIATFESLAQRLAGILRIRADVPIIIDPEDQVTAGEAIRVYDMARANGSVAVFLVAR